jgi:hypothetical protein
MIQVASSMSMVLLHSGRMMELEGSGHMITFSAAIREEAWPLVMSNCPIALLHADNSAHTRSFLNPPIEIQ